jgi:hypothetical protein
LPDFEAKSVDKLRKWGYSFSEIVLLLNKAVNDDIGENQTFNLVVHDWGAVIGFIHFLIYYILYRT